jgi:hypothetical protein
MVQNLVLNNSDVNFSTQWDQVRASQDQPRVVATPGTDAEVASNLRGQLESSTLAGAPRVDSLLHFQGAGINANYKA